MQTPYRALSYQIPTSRNCKPFKTQFCKLLLAAQDTNTQHLHDEIKVLLMDTHLKLHATQLKHKHTFYIHVLNAYSDPPRNTKATNNEHTKIIISKQDTTTEKCRESSAHSLMTNEINSRI